MRADEERLAAAQVDISFLQLRAPRAHGLDLPALQRQPRLVALLDEIFEARLAVFGDQSRRLCVFGHPLSVMGQCRMREVKRSALVSKPPSELFALINDIESYPQFLPWCTHARVQSRSQQEIVATLGVRQGALHGEFTTGNPLGPEHSLRMHRVSGPFSTLQGEGRLTPIEANGCRVELAMRFAFRNPLTSLLFDSRFAATIGSLVDAFVARARSRS